MLSVAAVAVALVVGSGGQKALGVDDAPAAPPKAEAPPALDAVPRAMKPPRRFALVIGVADYEDRRIPDLPACEKDATELAKVLRDPAIGMFPPGNVTLLTDKAVTRSAVVAALDDLARKAGPDDLVVVFYSGHGATDEKGRAYWVMSDAKVDALRSTALAELEISELLGEIKTRRLVTLIDACYSAATAELASTKSLIDVSKLYPEFKGDGRVGITASKGDQLSMVIKDDKDPGFGHSAFAFHLLEGLRGNADAGGNADGVVDLDELWAYVKDRTIETSRRQGGAQEPQLKGQFGSKFLLAVNAPRLAAISAEGKERAARDRARLDALEALFLAEELSALEREEARRLLAVEAATLSEVERRRRETYVDVADGRLPAKRLTETLAAIGAGASPVAAAAVTPATALADLAAKFPDVDAPVALVFHHAVAAGDPELAKAARVAAGWGVGGVVGVELPRVSLLAIEPFPDTSDSLYLTRGCIRLEPPEVTFAARTAVPAGDVHVATAKGERVVIGGAVTGALSVAAADRSTLSLTVSARGDAPALDRLLERATDARPAFHAALARAIAAAAPVALVAEAPWARERLRRWAEATTGRNAGSMFVGAKLVELSIDGDDEFARQWSIATDRLVSVAITAEPARDALRTTVRLGFLKASDAEGAVGLWRTFLDRIRPLSGGAVTPIDAQLDTQRDAQLGVSAGASVVLRLDVDRAALVRWLDEFCPVLGELGASAETAP
ncbi:MAG: caspase family protein [Phycisphaerae bacterium]|nr:caspase family protein [Phycisphaerae bacterium]